MKYKSVWIVGSSIVKYAFVRARTTNNVHLDVGRHQASVWWQGRSCMRWSHLEAKINQMLRMEEPPDLLIIDCGGYAIGIGHTQSIKLRKQMENTVVKLVKKLPSTRIVWSQILPRFKWRSHLLQSELNNIRVRINSKLASLVVKLGGTSIKYPELTRKKCTVFWWPWSSAFDAVR